MNWVSGVQEILTSAFNVSRGWYSEDDNLYRAFTSFLNSLCQFTRRGGTEPITITRPGTMVAGLVAYQVIHTLFLICIDERYVSVLYSIPLFSRKVQVNG